MAKKIFSILAIMSVAAIILTGCKKDEAAETTGDTAGATATTGKAATEGE